MSPHCHDIMKPVISRSIFFRICLLTGSVFFFVMLLVPIITFPKVLTYFLALRPGSKAFTMWQKTPVPVYMDVYMFNVTNAVQFARTNCNVKLAVEEVGPFVFREEHERVNVVWSQDGSTVSYNQTRKWIYVPERSVPLDSEITNFDVVNIVAARTSQHKERVEQAILNFIMKETSGLFVTSTAEEWLFKGMQNTLLDISTDVRIAEEWLREHMFLLLSTLKNVSSLPGQHMTSLLAPDMSSLLNMVVSSLPGQHNLASLLAPDISSLLAMPATTLAAMHSSLLPLGHNVTDILDKLLQSSPKLPDKFGFFYKRNMSATHDGHLEVSTGMTRLSDLGNAVRWNNQTQAKFFEGSCGTVKGSAGEIFPPTQGEEFSLFLTDICSTLTFKFSHTVAVKGLSGRQYIGDPTTFGNRTVAPENSCFCVNKDVCLPSGTRNISTCRDGAPVFISFPHFYLADPSYLKHIDGLSPNKSRHEFRLALEPETGAPLRVRGGIQVNLLLEPHNNFDFYKNVPRTLVPMFWMEQRAEISQDLVIQVLLLMTFRCLPIIMLFILTLLLTILIIIGHQKSSAARKAEELRLINIII